MRARGLRPCSLTAFSDAISNADAASFVGDDTAAVKYFAPSSNGNEAIFSKEVSRGPSSTLKSPSGTISRSKRPSVCAWRARRCDSSANTSMSSRLMFHFSAISSAPWNCETGSVP